MNINATLFGQMITFALFVWFTMRFVWPPVTKALADRQQKIADGLAAAERGEHELELAKKKSSQTLKEAKTKAQEIIEKATKHADQIIEESKEKAREEGLRLIDKAKKEIDHEIIHAKEALRKEIAGMAIQGAELLLGKQMDSAANRDLIDQFIREI